MKKEMKLIFSDGKIHLALLVMLLCFIVDYICSVVFNFL